MRKNLTKEEISGIIDNYVNKGWGQLRSGAPYGVGAAVVKSILKENDVPIRNFSQAAIISNKNRRVWNVNDHYFDIENPNMAYILGFIAADGSVNKKDNGILIGLSAIDGEFLEQIRQELKLERPLKYYITSNGYEAVKLYMTSEHMKNKLAEYNIVPNKTVSFTFPTKLNKRYWVDFIRGYFDGDGSISTAGKHAIRWQLCAYKPNVLETIVNFFWEEYEIPKVNIQNNPSRPHLYNIQYSSVPTRRIYEILYTPNTLYLKRKKDKFEEIL